jgi:hypothetical protein
MRPFGKEKKVLQGPLYKPNILDSLNFKKLPTRVVKYLVAWIKPHPNPKSYSNNWLFANKNKPVYN